MAFLPVLEFYVFNDSIQPVSNFTSLEEEGGVYEVLRVIESVPLFLEDHLERFYKSASLAGISILLSEIQIENLLNKLIEYNKVNEGNILISYQTNFKAFFIPHKYPTHEMVENGVLCGILRAERRIPNAKVFQMYVREQANQIMKVNGFYEVLLIDHNEKITEGSRSNVFFVKNDSIITPPAHKVLLGITRQKAIKLATENGIKCIEDDIYSKETDLFEAAFLTGTSPKILPISKLDVVNYNAGNKLVVELVENYNSLIQNYVKSKKENR